MVTPWPQVTAWPNDIREHATHLSDYLRRALAHIESNGDQPVPKPSMKTMIASMSVFIAKFQNTPDVRTIMQAITTIQSNLETTVETVQSTATRVQQNTTTYQQAVILSQETNQAVKEAAESRRTTTALIQETNDIAKATNDIAKAIQTAPPPKASYASVLSNNTVPLNKPNTISTQTSSFIQAQREIIIKITDPSTIESLHAKNPRNLQSHVDRAIEQSNNQHIKRIHVTSANQLKSGDLSIKTSNKNEADALKQFANDWINRIGRGTNIQLPTYGVLAHGIRTSTLDMEKFDEIKAELLHDNRPFIPNADIKYIGWLSRAARTKTASTIIVEFTSPEDANKIIDEGLIWQGEVFQCERYDRQCRLKQCYKCQRYGHIGTQCKANTACGYCAEAHDSKDCPTKVDKTVARKCATCKGAHEAWNNRCPVRKVELAKVKAAYDTRQPYHFVPTTRQKQTNESFTFSTAMVEPNRSQRGRPSSAAASAIPTVQFPTPGRQSTRSKSPTKGRAPKRINTGNTLDGTQDKNEDIVMGESSQRSRRPHVPSRRALESITTNAILSSQFNIEES